MDSTPHEIQTGAIPRYSLRTEIEDWDSFEKTKNRTFTKQHRFGEEITGKASIKGRTSALLKEKFGNRFDKIESNDKNKNSSNDEGFLSFEEEHKHDRILTDEEISKMTLKMLQVRGLFGELNLEQQQLVKNRTEYLMKEQNEIASTQILKSNITEKDVFTSEGRNRHEIIKRVITQSENDTILAQFIDPKLLEEASFVSLSVNDESDDDSVESISDLIHQKSPSQRAKKDTKFSNSKDSQDIEVSVDLDDNFTYDAEIDPEEDMWTLKSENEKVPDEKLNSTKADKYFGAKARISFFKTMRQVDHHRNLTTTKKNGDELEQTLKLPMSNNPFMRSYNELKLLDVISPRSLNKNNKDRRQRTIKHVCGSNEKALLKASKSFSVLLGEDDNLKADEEETGQKDKKDDEGEEEDFFEGDALKSSTPNRISNSKASAVNTQMAAKSGAPTSPSSKKPKIEKTSEFTFEEENPDGSEITYAPISPRALYIAGCLKDGVMPISRAVLRKELSSKLVMRGMCIGDSRALALANAMNQMPFLKLIDMSGNGLTEKSLVPIIDSLSNLPSVVEMDFSDNKISPKVADTLAKYLESKDCGIKRLVLSNANIDDHECTLFVEALQHSVDIEDIDLSKNMLGSAEDANLVMPDLQTAGESLASMLRSKICTVKRLNISHNVIRGPGAKDLCNSISSNLSLRYLNLGDNSLGKEAGMTLGAAIINHPCLEELDISRNSLDSTAFFTICISLRRHPSIRRVVADGNPIGEQGGRIAMDIVQYETQIDLSISDCNLSIDSGTLLMDRQYPVGNYRLELSNPYARAVCMDLLQLTARHTSLVARPLELMGDSPANGPVVIQKKALKIPEDELAPLAREDLEAERQVVAISKNKEKIISVFKEFDKDGSGALDYEEFGALLKKLGLHYSKKVIKQIVATVDMDGLGVLDEEEILEFFEDLGEESMACIYSIEYDMISIDKTSKNKNTPWVPPKTGTVQMTVRESFGDHRAVYAAKSSVERVVIKTMGHIQRSLLLNFAAENMQLQLDEARILHHGMVKEGMDKVLSLAELLPRMSSPIEVRKLVVDRLDNDHRLMVKLHYYLGNAFSVLLGNYDGYYCLDMSKENDRLCMSRLLQQNTEYNKHRLQFGHADVSQDGNWSCFRNEILEEDDHSITVENFNPLPEKGVVCFDFVGTIRPEVEFSPAKDASILRLLVKSGLLLESEMADAQEVLNGFRIEYERPTVLGKGNTPWVAPMKEVEETSEAMRRFYDDDSNRKHQFRQAESDEATAQPLNEAMERLRALQNPMDSLSISRPSTTADSPSGRSRSRATSHDIGGLRQGSISPDSASSRGRTVSVDNGAIANAIAKTKDIRKIVGNEDDEDDMDSDAEESLAGTHAESGIHAEVDLEDFLSARELTKLGLGCKPYSQFDPKPRGIVDVIDQKRPNSRPKSRQSDNEKQEEEQRLEGEEEEVKFKQSQMWKSLMRACDQTVEALVMLFSPRYLRARHLALTLQLFRAGALSRSDFGSYRVRLVTELSSRILDVQNMNIIMMELTPEERAHVYCRLGYLNLFCPWKPEGNYILDLKSFEERQVAKMLYHMGYVEPKVSGDNFRRLSYDPHYSGNPDEFFVFNENWKKEDNWKQFGLLKFEFFTGKASSGNIIKANSDLRNSLLGLTLMTHNLITDLLDADADKKDRDVRAQLPPLKNFTLEEIEKNMRINDISFSYRPIEEVTQIDTDVYAD